MCVKFLACIELFRPIYFSCSQIKYEYKFQLGKTFQRRRPFSNKENFFLFTLRRGTVIFYKKIIINDGVTISECKSGFPVIAALSATKNQGFS